MDIQKIRIMFFFLGKIIEGAGAKTFKYNSRTYTFFDKNCTYEVGEI